MWLAGQWTDYELLDCGRGEKLERWGNQLLVRPDPQAIWNAPFDLRSIKDWTRDICARAAEAAAGKNSVGSPIAGLFRTAI